MAKQSEYTQKIKKELWFWRIIDLLILLLPVIIYVCIALGNGGVTTTGKVTVVSTVVLAGIISVFNIISKKRLTCIPWIVLIGLYCALRSIGESLIVFIIIMAITTTIDNFILTPIIATLEHKFDASTTIDEREDLIKKESEKKE